MQEILEKLGELPDPRRQWGNLRHKLTDIVMIGLVSVICGGTDYEHMEDTGHGKLDWFRTFLEMPGGVPDSDTFRRVFERIDPKALASILQEVETVCGKTVAIDGKTIRGSANGQHKAYHVVSAWVAESQITLGQLQTEEKSNEIKAIPELLDILDVAGSTVTIDAMGCQKDIAAKIVEKGADYVLTLKANHENLLEDVSFYFDSEPAAESWKKTMAALRNGFTAWKQRSTG
jgi:predicted transposase YbfD/YdcC